MTASRQSPDVPTAALGPPSSVSKVSITIPTTLLDEARQRAGRGGLSGYLSDAVREQLAADRLAELNASLQAEFGPVPQQLIDRAEAAWPAGDR